MVFSRTGKGVIGEREMKQRSKNTEMLAVSATRKRMKEWR